MNTYMLQIIQMLVYAGGEVEITDVATHLNITKRMINYYLKQLNDIFAAYSLPEIILSNDKMILDVNDPNHFMNTLKEMIHFQDYIFNARERQEFILLLIGLTQETIGIEKIIDYFNVSKNTISNDLIAIKKELQKYSVKLRNKTKTGYYLDGDELMIRYVLMNCYHHNENFVLAGIKADFLLSFFSKNEDKKKIIDQISDILNESIRHSANSEYSYFAVTELIQTILLISVRKEIRSLKFNELTSEDKVDSIDFILNEFRKLDLDFTEDEELYLYYVLQSAKVSAYNQEKYSPNVLNLMKDIIENFEEISKLNLFGDNELSYMFLTHIKSMYYRTKYHIKICHFQAASMDDKAGYYYISQRVMKTVAEKYHLTYDEDEIRLLSYYFACLDNDSEVKESKNNIIIVRISGVSSSLFLKNQCSKIFGPHFAIKICDRNQLQENIDMKTRLIVSTVDLDKKKLGEIDLIKVHSILTNDDRQNLLEWYLESDHGDREQEIIQDIIEIINQYTVIQDKQKLYYSLNNYFRGNMEETKIQLSNIFSSEYVRIAEKSDSWQQLLRLAGEPLVDEEIIKPSYIEDIEKVLEEHGPYCECMDGILVAHAEPKNNVKYPSLSLAVVREPVIVPEWHKKIRAIFVLGVVDTELHANAFSELMANLVRDELYLTLNTLSDSDEIYRRITL